METVEYKNISFTVWDVGGQDKVCGMHDCIMSSCVKMCDFYVFSLIKYFQFNQKRKAWTLKICDIFIFSYFKFSVNRFYPMSSLFVLLAYVLIDGLVLIICVIISTQHNHKLHIVEPSCLSSFSFNFIREGYPCCGLHVEVNKGFL